MTFWINFFFNSVPNKPVPHAKSKILFGLKLVVSFKNLGFYLVLDNSIT